MKNPKSRRKHTPLPPPNAEMIFVCFSSCLLHRFLFLFSSFLYFYIVAIKITTSNGNVVADGEKQKPFVQYAYKNISLKKIKRKINEIFYCQTVFHWNKFLLTSSVFFHSNSNPTTLFLCGRKQYLLCRPVTVCIR